MRAKGERSCRADRHVLVLVLVLFQDGKDGVKHSQADKIKA